MVGKSGPKRTGTKASLRKYHEASPNTSQVRAADARGAELIQAWLTGDVNTFLFVHFFLRMYCTVGPQSAVCRDNGCNGGRKALRKVDHLLTSSNTQREKKTKVNVTL